MVSIYNVFPRRLSLFLFFFFRPFTRETPAIDIILFYYFIFFYYGRRRARPIRSDERPYKILSPVRSWEATLSGRIRRIRPRFYSNFLTWKRIGYGRILFGVLCVLSCTIVRATVQYYGKGRRTGPENTSYTDGEGASVRL